MSVIPTKPQATLSKSGVSNIHTSLAMLMCDVNNSKPISVLVKKQEIGKSPTLLKRYKQQLTSFSMIERQVAIGIMLGDASLHTQDGGKSFRLKLLQGDKNKDYLFHLCDVFSRWILSPPSPQDRQSKTTGNCLKAWRNQTVSHKSFNFLANIFLDERGKKRIPPNLVKEHLTDRGLAYWLMDDGGKSNYNKDRPQLKVTRKAFQKQR